MAYEVRREELASLRAEWAQLLDQQPEPAPFLHPAWHQVWLEEFQAARDLLLLSVRDGDALIGIAPLLRDDGRLSFVGHYSICDYMDFIVAPGRGGDVFPALLEALLQEEWSDVELRGLRESSATLAELPKAADSAGLALEREVEAVAPRVPLPADWEAYLASLSKKDRHELRRKLRRAEGGKPRIEVARSPAAVAALVDSFVALHRKSKVGKARFMDEAMERFFREVAAALAAAGWAALWLLWLEDRPAAALFCLEYGGTVGLYNSGFDPEARALSPGVVLIARTIEDALRRGFRRYDFLRGDDPYKYGFGAVATDVLRITLERSP